MKITIRHNDTTIIIDEFNPEITSLKYNHEVVIKYLQNACDQILKLNDVK